MSLEEKVEFLSKKVENLENQVVYLSRAHLQLQESVVRILGNEFEIFAKILKGENYAKKEN